MGIFAGSFDPMNMSQVMPLYLILFTHLLCIALSSNKGGAWGMWACSLFFIYYNFVFVDCPAGWTGFQNKCYFFSHTMETWSSASVKYAVEISKEKFVKADISP